MRNLGRLLKAAWTRSTTQERVLLAVALTWAIGFTAFALYFGGHK